MEFEDDIDALFATYQSLPPMKEVDSARLWQKFRLDWNYNSNRIEGNTLTRGETKALLEDGIKPIKMRKDILQMQSHDKAIDVLRELANSERPLTEADIRELHKTALGENYWTEAKTIDGTITRREIEIGTYKQKPNKVDKQDGTEHVYAQPFEVSALMGETMKRLRLYLKKRDKSLHDYLADLHQDFIQTHPFDDGNGRVVRLLINYVSLHLGWPPVIIKSEKRSEYIASLESWNDGDERPFRELMKRELTWSLKVSIAAARGENIDEPDDVDKEIDLFVRESSDHLYKRLKNEDSIVSVFRASITPILKNLDTRLLKLSKLFSFFMGEQYETLAIEHLIEENEIQSMIKKSSFEAEYYFGSLHFKSNPINIEVKIRAKFFDNSYVITGHINEGNTTNSEVHLIMKNAHHLSRYEFSEHSYGTDVSEKSVQVFCDAIARGVMAEITYYKGLSYVI